jgi:hypothetical protein
MTFSFLNNVGRSFLVKKLNRTTKARQVYRQGAQISKHSSKNKLCGFAASRLNLEAFFKNQKSLILVLKSKT